MQKRNSGYMVQRILNMELPDRRKRGRPQRRFTVQRVGVTEDDDDDDRVS